MGFSRQGYWSELPCCVPGNPPDPGIKLMSPVLQADSLPTEPPGRHLLTSKYLLNFKSQVVYSFFSVPYILSSLRLRFISIWIHLILIIYMVTTLPCTLISMCFQFLTHCLAYLQTLNISYFTFFTWFQTLHPQIIYQILCIALSRPFSKAYPLPCVVFHILTPTSITSSHFIL